MNWSWFDLIHYTNKGVSISLPKVPNCGRVFLVFRKHLFLEETSQNLDAQATYTHRFEQLVYHRCIAQVSPFLSSVCLESCLVTTFLHPSL